MCVTTAPRASEKSTHGRIATHLRASRPRVVAMSDVAARRLAEERKNWRKDHPPGFFARPERAADGTVDLFRWKCVVPGAKDTAWAGAFIPLAMEFPREYPAKPMKCKFPKGFYHPNVYPSGTVCLSILNEDEGWRPSVSVKQVALGIQELLHTPNEKSPAQSEAYVAYTTDRASYDRRVREEVAKYPPPS